MKTTKEKSKSVTRRKAAGVGNVKLFLGHIRPALSSLDGGDTDAAGEYLATASAFCPSLAMRKQLEKVQDECSHGSLEKAEAILEQLVSDAATILQSGIIIETIFKSTGIFSSETNKKYEAYT